MTTQRQLKLSQTSAGRIELHLLTILRDGHIKSHLRGIVRELRRKR